MTSELNFLIFSTNIAKKSFMIKYDLFDVMKSRWFKIDVWNEFDENVKNKVIDLNKREDFDVMIDLTAIIVHVIFDDVKNKLWNVIKNVIDV